MGHDRHLIDTIKLHFAAKSLAQLRVIAQGNDPDRWSREAVTAAVEVLEDRAYGQAREPEVPEPERPPPPSHPDGYSLAFLALGLLGSMSGHLHFHVHRVDYEGEPDPDLPVAFGPKMAWLALDTRDTAAVASALGLLEVQPSTWKVGIEAAHQSSVFVTPPLSDWTLVLGTALFPTASLECLVKPLLMRLSGEFGEAQYFCTHRDYELHAWARSRKGRIERGYGWLGREGLTLWQKGPQTKEERDLGVGASVEPSPTADPTKDTHITASTARSGDRAPTPGEAGQSGALGTTPPDEGCVLQLASLWSIDPSSLDALFKEPETGLLGTASWAADQGGNSQDL